jgi:hypothetical protein
MTESQLSVSPKNAVKRLLDSVPDEASFEDIQYHIYVLGKIENGLKDCDERDAIPQEEIERRMVRWLGK